MNALLLSCQLQNSVSESVSWQISDNRFRNMQTVSNGLWKHHLSRTLGRQNVSYMN
jgi:hypothetical protein